MRWSFGGAGNRQSFLFYSILGIHIAGIGLSVISSMQLSGRPDFDDLNGFVQVMRIDEEGAAELLLRFGEWSVVVESLPLRTRTVVAVSTDCRACIASNLPFRRSSSLEVQTSFSTASRSALDIAFSFASSS
jgi:hypothetical protein